MLYLRKETNRGMPITTAGPCTGTLDLLLPYTVLYTYCMYCYASLGLGCALLLPSGDAITWTCIWVMRHDRLVAQHDSPYHKLGHNGPGFNPVGASKSPRLSLCSFPNSPGSTSLATFPSPSHGDRDAEAAPRAPQDPSTSRRARPLHREGCWCSRRRRQPHR
jgi:hypothetical protein